jgi:hypothetical protein
MCHIIRRNLEAKSIRVVAAAVVVAGGGVHVRERDREH